MAKEGIIFGYSQIMFYIVVQRQFHTLDLRDLILF